MLKWVDDDLVAWGKFFRDSNNGLGYPTCTTDARMQQGCVGNDNKGKQAMDGYVPERIAVTESLVLAMPHEYIAVAQVAYMVNGSLERKAGVLSRRLMRRISRRNFSNMLENLHHRIEARAEVLHLIKKPVDSRAPKSV